MKSGLIIKADLRKKEWRLIKSKGYEEADTDYFISNYLSPGMVMFDVGARIGVMTLIGAFRVGQTGMVHSFEPHPQNAKTIQNAIIINKLSNVALNQIAVGKKSGKILMGRPAVFPEYDRLVCINTEHSQNETLFLSKIEINIISLDDYFFNKKLSYIDLIKIDVDGAELDVLKGSLNIIRKYKPAIIVEAGPLNLAYGYSYKDIYFFLRNFDYKIFAFSRIDLTSRGMTYIENIENSPFFEHGGEGNIFALPSNSNRLSHPKEWLRIFSKW